MQVELNNDESSGSSSMAVPLRLSQPMPCIKTAPIKQKRQVMSEETVSGGEREAQCAACTHFLGKSAVSLGLELKM